MKSRYEILMNSITIDFVLFTAGVFVFSIILHFCVKRNEFGSIKAKPNGDKIIEISKTCFTLTVLCVAAMLIFGLYVIFVQNFVLVGLMYIVFCLIYALVNLPFYFSDISVIWNKDYIEGPNLKSSGQKTRIHWGDVESIKNSIDEGRNPIPASTRVWSKKGQGLSINISHSLFGWGQIIGDARSFDLEIDLSDFD